MSPPSALLRKSSEFRQAELRGSSLGEQGERSGEPLCCGATHLCRLRVRSRAVPGGTPGERHLRHPWRQRPLPSSRRSLSGWCGLGCARSALPSAAPVSSPKGCAPRFDCPKVIGERGSYRRAAVSSTTPCAWRAGICRFPAVSDAGNSARASPRRRSSPRGGRRWQSLRRTSAVRSEGPPRASSRTPRSSLPWPC